MIRREGRKMVISGPVTLATAAQLLEAGRQHLAEGVGTVDLSEVSELDSSLIALALAWLREAREAKRELAFANPPESLKTLCRLYGVEQLLPVASA